MNDREIAAQGLDITGYAGKWKAAQKYENRSPRTDDTKLLPYWERVQLTFLELGGGYAGQRGPQSEGD
jgi:hypothetical protein